MQATAAISTGRANRLQNLLRVREHSSRARFTVLCVFFAIVCLLGGGSRGDIVSLAVLRPLSFLFLAYGAIGLARRDVGNLGMPPWIVAAMVLLAAVQLVPLPPDIWATLPGREALFDISGSLGLETVWRPLSLAPSRTLNTLFSLGVPLAMFAVVAIQDEDVAPKLVWLLLVAGAATAVISVLQVIGPPNGPLYFYRITNNGIAVGLFSNRNHNAIFLASLIPLLTYAAVRFGKKQGRPGNPTVVAISFGTMLVIVPLILISGSRAGTGLMFAGTVASAALYFLHQRAGGRPGAGGGGPTVARLVPLLVIAGIGLITWLTYVLARSLAFDRIMRDPLDGGLREDALPLLWQLVKTYFPVGSGFGSFEQVYKVIEPDALLEPAYLNQAHNDLLQILIEGGLPGGLIMLAGVLWLARAGWRSWSAFSPQAQRSRGGPLALFAWLSLVMIVSGSIVDYPLRVPSLMAVVVLLCCIIELACRPRGAKT